MRPFDYFVEGLKRCPDRAVIVDGDVRLTFRQVDAITERVAAGLHDMGAGEGTHAAVLAPNDARILVAILSIQRVGGVWLPVNVRNTAEINARFLARARCEALFFHSSMAEEAAEIRSRVPGLRHLICLDRPHAPAMTTLGELESFRGAPAAEPPDDPHRRAMVMATGGTTGLAKAAEWSNRVYETAVKTLEACLPEAAEPVHLAVAPMSHAAGGLCLWLLSSGATTVVEHERSPAAILEAIQRHRITHLYLPPTLLYLILAHPELDRFDLDSIACLFITSAPVAPQKLAEAMEVFPGAVCQSYGQAEAPMLLTFMSAADLEARPAEGPDRLASCGRPTPFSQVEIMGPDGSLLPSPQIGEIVARSDLVMTGYFDDPEATAAVSAHGWHHTGDIGFKDSQGFVYIVDRAKDMIITGGFNVFSAEVEQVILGHRAVQDCVVVGAPHDKWGEAVTAVIQLKPGASATAEEIRRLVREHLGGVHTPKSVEFWPELPLSVNGKVLKREVRQKFWVGHDRAI